MTMRRRSFLQTLGAIHTVAALSAGANAEAEDRSLPKGSYAPGRIPNEYCLLFPGEREALDAVPRIARIHHGTVISRIESKERTVKPGDLISGWQLVTVASIKG